MYAMSRILWGLALGSLAPTHANSQGVVGPGGVTTYSGGAAQQQRGYGYVREPAEGFFVGGSTLTEMNGVYKRVQNVPQGIKHKPQLAYRKWPADQHDPGQGWHMVLAQPQDGATHEITGGKASEWLIIDDNDVDRFGHEGETVIPGAGTRWSFLHREPDDPQNPNFDPGLMNENEPGSRWNRQSEPTGANANAVDTVGTPPPPPSDGEDELPWQVIFIGDPSMVENLRRHKWHYDHEIQLALSGSKLPPTAESPNGDAPHPDLEKIVLGQPAVAAAASLLAEGDYKGAALAYAELLQAPCPTSGEGDLEELCRSGDPAWVQWRWAILRLAKARAHRRTREFPEVSGAARAAACSVRLGGAPAFCRLEGQR
jgi:hypothetical protein